MHGFIFCHGPGITSLQKPFLFSSGLLDQYSSSRSCPRTLVYSEVEGGEDRLCSTPTDTLLHSLLCSLQIHQCWLHCLLPALKAPAIEGGRSVRLSSPCSLQHRTVPYSTLFTCAMIYTAHHDYQLAHTTFKLFFWPCRASLPAHYF